MLKYKFTCLNNGLWVVQDINTGKILRERYY